MNLDAKKSLKKLQPICIELLNSFTETELDQFSHFINCYYFNTDKSVVKLFENLQKRILNKNSFNETEQKIIFEQVFGMSTKEFTFNKKEKKHLNAKMSLLKNLAEQFLSIEGLMESPAKYNGLLLNKLLNKGQNRLLERHFNELTKKTKNTTQENIELYDLRQTIEFCKRDHSFQTGLIYSRTTDNLDVLNFNFDTYYLVKKLDIFIAILSLETISTTKHNRSSFENIKSLLSLPQYKKHPLINLYQSVVNLLIYKTQNSYENLLNTLHTSFSLTSKEDLIAFYNVATNYCVQQIRLGEFDYADLFDLYLEMDDKNLLIENNTISILKIMNIITVACRIKSFENAELLIEKYRPFIRKHLRNSVCNYNYGAIAFYKKEYNQALKYFIRVGDINLEYDVNCRVVILKCHYEMDKHYDERTMQIFRSANKFFNDNKIKHHETKMQLSRAKEKLDAQEVNSDKNWLQTKMDELEEVKK